MQVLEAGHFAQLTDEQVGLLRQWIADGASEGPSEGAAGGETPPAGETSTPEPDVEYVTPTEDAVESAGEGVGATETPTQVPPTATQPAAATEEYREFWSDEEPAPTESSPDTFWDE